VTTELPQERPKVPSLKRPPKAQLGAAGKRSKPPINPSLSKMQQMEQGPTRSTLSSATVTAEGNTRKILSTCSYTCHDRNSEVKKSHNFLVQHKDQSSASIWMIASLKIEGKRDLGSIGPNLTKELPLLR
jgi:hypothetical protein